MEGRTTEKQSSDLTAASDTLRHECITSKTQRDSYILWKRKWGWTKEREDFWKKEKKKPREQHSICVGVKEPHRRITIPKHPLCFGTKTFGEKTFTHNHEDVDTRILQRSN